MPGSSNPPPMMAATMQTTPIKISSSTVVSTFVPRTRLRRIVPYLSIPTVTMPSRGTLVYSTRS